MSIYFFHLFKNVVILPSIFQSCKISLPKYVKIFTSLKASSSSLLFPSTPWPFRNPSFRSSLSQVPNSSLNSKHLQLQLQLFNCKHPLDLPLSLSKWRYYYCVTNFLTSCISPAALSWGKMSPWWFFIACHNFFQEFSFIA